jgi:hypothetical protein
MSVKMTRNLSYSESTSSLPASQSRRLHTGLMNFRATSAGVVTAIMLFVSSAASICEAKCEVGGLRPARHSEAASPHTDGAQMGPGMCHGDAGAKSSTVPTMEVSLSSPCSHHVCAQQPATLTDQRSAIAHVPVPLGMAHVNAHFEPERLVVALAGRGPPSFRHSTPVDLHIIQRV